MSMWMRYCCKKIHLVKRYILRECHEIQDAHLATPFELSGRRALNFKPPSTKDTEVSIVRCQSEFNTARIRIKVVATTQESKNPFNAGLRQSCLKHNWEASR